MRSKIMSGIGYWFRSNYMFLVIISLLLMWGVAQYYNNIQNNKTKIVNILQDSFDLSVLPSGVIVWSHGVPGFEADFKNADSTSRYYYFDVGILTRTNIIHVVRVPYYVLGALNRNYPIDFRKYQNKKDLKRNLKPTSYVYQYERNLKINKEL